MLKLLNYIVDNEQILEKISDKYENHPIVKDIKDRISEVISFSFAKASVCDIIKGVDPKSATGFDTIPTKLVILSFDVIAKPLTQLINVTKLYHFSIRYNQVFFLHIELNTVHNTYCSGWLKDGVNALMIINLLGRF